jgi:hypothetical protein
MKCVNNVFIFYENLYTDMFLCYLTLNYTVKMWHNVERLEKH